MGQYYTRTNQRHQALYLGCSSSTENFHKKERERGILPSFPALARFTAARYISPRTSYLQSFMAWLMVAWVNCFPDIFLTVLCVTPYKCQRPKLGPGGDTKVEFFNLSETWVCPIKLIPILSESNYRDISGTRSNHLSAEIGGSLVFAFQVERVRMYCQNQ
jgi:hypothetical protein